MSNDWMGIGSKTQMTQSLICSKELIPNNFPWILSISFCEDFAHLCNVNACQIASLQSDSYVTIWILLKICITNVLAISIFSLRVSGNGYKASKIDMFCSKRWCFALRIFIFLFLATSHQFHSVGRLCLFQTIFFLLTKKKFLQFDLDSWDSVMATVIRTKKKFTNIFLFEK